LCEIITSRDIYIIFQFLINNSEIAWFSSNLELSTIILVISPKGMDSLSAFIDDISAYEINLPLWLQSGIILVIIAVLVVGGYFLRDTFDVSALRSGYVWFIAIAVINLITIFLIFTYYGKTAGNYPSPPGNRGKKGKRGKAGTSVSCSYECKTNIYLQSVRKTDTVCRLDVYDSNFQTLYAAFSYFQNILDAGNSIDYTGLINNIILGNALPGNTTLNQTAISNFQTLMTSPAIAWYLIKVINADITTASENTYGTFRTPVPKVGYLPLGDSVFGGTETFSLNSFVVSGDIMYPAGYTKLTTLSAFNAKTGDVDTFTIWRQQVQTVSSPGFKGFVQQNSYLPLGDLISFGTSAPPIDNYAMIKDTCLESVPSTDLNLVFIYVGSLGFDSDSNTEQYKQTNSYLVQNPIVDKIEIFSVWRTPMNTFICNFNSENDLVNNTIYYNLIYNLSDSLNEYGNISQTYKTWVNNRLSSITLPSILIAMIYTRHYQLDATKELIYYMNKYQSQVPEFQHRNIGTMDIAGLMNLINNTNQAYNKYNQNLIKQASISLRATTPLVYDSNKEKHLPAIVLTTYNNIQAELDTIPVKVENSSTLLDVVNIIIPNGLEGRIAVNSDGIAQGGTLLNDIQETVVRMCRVLMPPATPAYTIKDECLGTFSIDKEKEKAVSELTKEKDTYNKYIDTIQTHMEKYQSQIATIRNYEDLAQRKIGELCGHIPNYMEKIHNMDMTEITTSRVKGLIGIYREVNGNLAKIISNTS
jgi:hypothetical protein